MANVVREDQEIASRIEWPSGSKQSLHVVLAQECIAVSTGPVDHKYGIIDSSLAIAMRRAKSGIVDAQARQGFAITEAVIIEPCVALRSGCAPVLCPRGIDFAHLYIAFRWVLLCVKASEGERSRVVAKATRKAENRSMIEIATRLSPASLCEAL
jgi:hypothetical protein